MRSLYFDYNATTPIAPEVLQTMLPFLADHYGNPSSGHSLGQFAHQAVEQARAEVAQLLGAQAAEIIFTGGGTESNNLAIQGTLLRDLPRQSAHLIISAIEHPATTQPAAFLERLGFDVTVVGCDSAGCVSTDEVAAALRDDTQLVSIMHANNEVGTLQPIREIADRCHERGVLIHTDAAQSIGKVAVDVNDLGVDLLTLAGHKLYAPKGIGALFVRQGVTLEPVLHGAAHECGLRPGTENVPYIVGLGRAATLATEHLPATARTAELRDRLWQSLRDAIGPELSCNGIAAERLPNTLSVNFPAIDGNQLLSECPQLCASTGAACHSGGTARSATLAAMGVSEEAARGTVRLSLGRGTTAEDVEQAAQLLLQAWQRLAVAPGTET